MKTQKLTLLIMAFLALPFMLNAQSAIGNPTGPAPLRQIDKSQNIDLERPQSFENFDRGGLGDNVYHRDATLNSFGYFPLIGDYSNRVHIADDYEFCPAVDFDGNGDLYRVKYDTKLLEKVDKYSGEILTSNPLVNLPEIHEITSLSWNPVNNTMYLMTVFLDYNEENYYSTQIFELNLETGFCTPLFEEIENSLGITLAIDNDGIGFMFDIYDDNWYTMNLTNGQRTILGVAVPDINFTFGQEADVDPATNNLYWGGISDSPGDYGMYQVNKQTGASTLLYDFDENYVPFIAIDNPYPEAECPAPSDIQFTSTTTTISGSLTENGSATMYDLATATINNHYQVDFDNPVFQNIPAPFTHSGMSPGQTYELWVRADCSGDDTLVSDWVGPFNPTTQALTAKISPNPTTGIIQFDGAEITSIQVFDNYGKVVHQQQVDNNQAQLNALPMGNYTIHAMDTNKGLHKLQVIKR